MLLRVWVFLCLISGLAGLALFATSCGGSNNAHLRLINAMPTQNDLDMLIDGSNVASSVAYATASASISVSSGNRHVQIEPTGSSTPLIDTNTSVNSGASVTALAYLNTSNSPSSNFLADNDSAPSSGNFNLRIINASPAMGSSVDVYVEPLGTGVSGTATVSGLSEGSASTYISLSAATSWHVIFTFAGTPNIIFDSGVISSISAGQVWSVVALNSQQGGFTFAALHDAG
jgi:hypothetical protein